MKDKNGLNIYTEIEGEAEVIENICRNLNSHGVSLFMLTDAIRKSAILCEIENRKESTTKDNNKNQKKIDDYSNCNNTNSTPSHSANEKCPNSIEKVEKKSDMKANSLDEKSTKNKHENKFDVKGTEELRRNKYFYDLLKNKMRIIQHVNEFNSVSIDESNSRSIG